MSHHDRPPPLSARSLSLDPPVSVVEVLGLPVFRVVPCWLLAGGDAIACGPNTRSDRLRDLDGSGRGGHAHLYGIRGRALPGDLQRPCTLRFGHGRSADRQPNVECRQGPLRRHGAPSARSGVIRVESKPEWVRYQISEMTPESPRRRTRARSRGGPGLSRHTDAVVLDGRIYGGRAVGADLDVNYVPAEPSGVTKRDSG